MIGVKFAFSESVRERFTLGACHVLARELHRRHGWKLYAIGCEGLEEHALVRHPSGLFIDIEGAHTRRSILKRWKASSLRAVDDSVFDDFDGYGPNDARYARSAADRILKALAERMVVAA